MKRYNPSEIEPAWQKVWDEQKTYKAHDASDKPKYYALSFFPYPSGIGLHLGHTRNFTITDVVARYKRMTGHEVLHPVGWDSFGLPAENFAIKTGVAPHITTKQNTDNFRRQMKRLGFSIDWDREFGSTDPDFYRWTQWFFLLLHQRGLAYQKESAQFWCPVCKTVLANEQVVGGGFCWRHEDTPVEKKLLKQWFFKITDYAERLGKDLDDIDWPEGIKAMQRNWIGRSKGAEVHFKIADFDETITVFTTRPDTLFGATFMVLAPEHPLVQTIMANDQKQAVESYVKSSQGKTDIDRMDQSREKTGVFTGAYAVNPVNGEKLPIWIADYVLMGYGTGAVMAVPAHDERDFEFATAHNLPIKQVVAPETGEKRDNETAAAGGCAVVFDPATQKYAFARLENGSTNFFAGGVGPDEDLHQGILREVAEESGLTDIRHTEEIGVSFSHYRNILKKTNRVAKATALLVILNSNKAEATKLEAHEKFSTVWLDAKEVLDQWNARDDGDYDHYAYFLRHGVARAIKEGYDTTSDPHIFKESAISGEGLLINSGEFSDMPASTAREKITAWLAEKGVGEEKVNFKIRDWLISRQRYWGAPIPIIHCQTCGTVPVPEDQLPVTLPELDDFEPSGDGRSPLARVRDWVEVDCPQCGGKGERETDTMDGFACSSWYFLRFADPKNNEAAFSKDLAEKWLPVDMYVGGAEHAVMHLLYARMWTKVMQDAGLISFGEPFKALRNQGMLLAADGSKFSKSKGNDIKPEVVIDDGYGADALRVITMFLAPYDQSTPWSNEGLAGAYRFLQRAWTLQQEYLEAHAGEGSDRQIEVAYHKATKRVTEDLHKLSFNTAIAALMEYVNELYKIKAAKGFESGASWRNALERFALLVAPIAPHIAEELWSQLSHYSSVHLAEWPEWDENLLVQDTIKIVVQVNGKLRATLDLSKDVSEDDAKAAALADSHVRTFVGETEPKRIVYVPGRLVNIVV